MPNAKGKLLIVDDDASVRESLAELFTEFGLIVRSAEDCPSALLEIRREVPDIILSDLNMPRMSGFEFLSVVSRWFPTIPGDCHERCVFRRRYTTRDCRRRVLRKRTQFEPSVADRASYDFGRNDRHLCITEPRRPIRTVWN